MKSEKSQISKVLSGAALFTFLFWRQGIGLNATIFTVLITLYLYFTKIMDFTNKKILFVTIGLWLSAVFVLVNNSVTSIIVYFLSMFVFLGFMFAPEIKTVYYAFIAFFYKTVTTQKQAFSSLNKVLNSKNKLKIFRYLKMTIIPLIVLLVFHLIFKNANPVYASYTNYILEKISNVLARIFATDFIYMLNFYIISIVIVNIFVFEGYKNKFNNTELNKTDDLIRKREKNKNFKMLSLKSENISGVLIVITINLLLLIINMIDINWIWFDTITDNPATLSQLVHKGTYLLILSIFLSMAIILYYFRKNQNFYPKNKVLKVGAYIWLIQNVILAISVLLRNYYYIQNAGLAYKRIGVFFFLILIITGLILMYIKIKDKKSMFYLLKTNSWSVFIVMIMIAAFNWDVLISKYNLSHNLDSGIDRVFLYQMSNKALYVIDNKNDMILNNHVANYKNRRLSLNDNDYWNGLLKRKILYFIQNYEKRSWKSWNYADYKSYRALKKKYPEITAPQ